MLFLLACSLPAYATDWVAKVTQQSTVYAKANTSSKVLGKVKANTVLTVDATKNGWARVTMNGKTGFMKAANVKKTTKTMYVNVASMAVYASNKTSSKKLAAMAYGESVKMEATNGEWARIVNGRKVGFCKKSSLTSKNPNTMKTTVYTQSANVKVYKHPSTSADLKGTLKKMNTKLTVVAMFDGQTWCRVKNGSQYGFIKKSDLDTRKYDGYSTARGAGGKAIAMDWWKSSIQSIFPRGGTAIVTDVKTGITWKVYRGRRAAEDRRRHPRHEEGLRQRLCDVASPRDLGFDRRQALRGLDELQGARRWIHFRQQLQRSLLHSLCEQPHPRRQRRVSAASGGHQDRAERELTGDYFTSST